MKICLLGTGAYGLALALELAKKDHEIMMWTESNEKYDEFVIPGIISLTRSLTVS